MLGIDDPWIWLGYLFTIGLALACVLYGLLNWNKEGGQ
ncbi:symporter small accessory protein [Methanooceanicella nereidis]